MTNLILKRFATIKGGQNKCPSVALIANHQINTNFADAQQERYSSNIETTDGCDRQLHQQTKYCNLAAIYAAKHCEVPITLLMGKTRAKAGVARARQIAIYVAHTTFSVPYREAATFFQRDRTTIAHACKTIEDKRDDECFDAKVSLIENLVEEAACFPEYDNLGFGRIPAEFQSEGGLPHEIG